MGLTKPRTRKPVSQATQQKLSKAMSDPTKTMYGVSLRQNAVAPDGGSWANYNLGHRFLPADMVLPDNYLTGDGSLNANVPATDREKFLGAPYTLHEIMLDQTHVDSDRSKPIKVTSFGLKVIKALKDLHNSNGDNPKAQKVIDDAYHQLILAPQIKAQEELLAKQKKDKELEYATLKMRVIELEKKPAPVVSISPDNNWSKYAILGIGVVIFLIILRRRK